MLCGFRAAEQQLAVPQRAAQVRIAVLRIRFRGRAIEGRSGVGLGGPVLQVLFASFRLAAEPLRQLAGDEQGHEGAGHRGTEGCRQGEESAQRGVLACRIAGIEDFAQRDFVVADIGIVRGAGLAPARTQLAAALRLLETRRGLGLSSPPRFLGEVFNLGGVRHAQSGSIMGVKPSRVLMENPG